MSMNVRSKTALLGEIRELTKRVADLEMPPDETGSSGHSEEEAERKYRLLADNVTDVILTFDFNFNFTYVSPSAAVLSGYTDIEVMAMSVQDILTQDSFVKAAAMLMEELEIERQDLKDLSRSRTLEIKLLHKDGSEIWIETKVTFLRNEADTAIEVIGIARDIQKRKLAEEALEKSCRKLKKTLQGTVQAIATMGELRDPYTAGHQRRVVNLAVSIARVMGLAEDRIDELSIAGTIHDLGKISIPAEILSKPGSLTELEENMMRTHTKVGYDILKSIDFPGAAAQILYQHHERYNGTGYPRGLSGEDILLEARILSVADVVEAMASHRPYRAALGIDSALAEIEDHRGILYDPQSVDACLTLFREQGFDLTEVPS